MTGNVVYILLNKSIEDTNKRIDNLPKAFVPQGNINFANLPATPAEDKLGYIWNINDEFTTDDRFIEGAGKKYPAGNNVACIKHDNNYYYDVMSVIDLSNYYTKVEVDNLIAAEKLAREAADNVLTTDLQTEVERATQEEVIIQNNLNNEITTRSNNDITLHNEILTEVNTRETAINNVNESINQEAITREQADLTLNTNINTEITRATNAESTLTTNLDAEVTRANYAESTIDTKIDTEITNRINADNTKVDIKTIIPNIGTSYVSNTVGDEGSCLQFTHTDGTVSAVAVNDGGKTGITAQIYSKDNSTNIGSRLNVTTDGIYYTKAKNNASYTANDEIVNKSDLTDYRTAADQDTIDATKANSSDVVTLTGNQDIYGDKAFHSPVMYFTGLNATKLDDKKIVTTGAMSPAITYNLPSKMEGEYTLATEDYVTEQISTKQDTIDDLSDIRDGAALGKTALQSVPSTYRTAADQDTIDNGKQDKLVSGTNIKTINSTSLLGSGDIEVKTFQPFPSDFKTGEQGESLADFISSVENSSGAKEGMAYLGSIYNDVLPWTGGGNAECKVEYMCDWIALVTVSSSNIAPYYWTMNTNEGTWRGVQGKLTAGTNITIDENNVISATGSGSSYTAETPIEITDNTIKHKEYFARDSYGFGIVYYDKYGHVTTINGQEVTGGLLHQANKITVNTGKGLEVDSDSNELKAVGVEYKNNDTVQTNALKFVKLTQAQYDALTTKDADTLYIIQG